MRLSQQDFLPYIILNQYSCVIWKILETIEKVPKINIDMKNVSFKVNFSQQNVDLNYIFFQVNKSSKKRKIKAWNLTRWMEGWLL